MEISHLVVTKLELQEGDILVIKGVAPDEQRHVVELMENLLREQEIHGVKLVMAPSTVNFEIIRDKEHSL